MELRKVIGAFVDKISAEHNTESDKIEADKRWSDLAANNRRVSAIIKMDRMRTYTEEALNGPSGLSSLPKWIQKEFEEYRKEKSESMKGVPMSKAGQFIEDVKDEFGFLGAVSDKSSPIQYRIHAEMKDGNVGITPWYTEASLDALKKDIIKQGHKIIKIEKKV